MAPKFCQDLCAKIFILVFEAMGSFMLTCIYQASVSNNQLLTIFIGFFVILILSAPISGSHYNPAVTLAFMLRRDTGRFSRGLGLFYILFQYLGALLGGIFIYDVMQARATLGLCTLNNVDPSPLPEGVTAPVYWSQAIFSDCIGGCILVFLYLTQTEAKYELTADPAIKMLIVSGAYVLAIFIGADNIMQVNYAGKNVPKATINKAFDDACSPIACPGGVCAYNGKMSFSPINPAIASGIIGADIISGGYESHLGFVFCLFPYAGALLGVVLYECAYKRAVDAVAEEAEHSDFSGEDENDKEDF